MSGDSNKRKIGNIIKKNQAEVGKSVKKIEDMAENEQKFRSIHK